MIYMDKDILYTAITRAKEFNKLHFIYEDNEE